MNTSNNAMSNDGCDAPFNNNNSIEQMKNITEYLESLGYKHYPDKDVKWPVIEKSLFQVTVPSLAVCETNDKLSINIEKWQFHFSEKPSYEISITAERGGEWWDLKCYSVNEENLIKNLESIRSTLIMMFNSIPADAVSDTTGDNSSNADG
jgi:hypothetical protein